MEQAEKFINRDLSLRILEVAAENRDLHWQLTQLTAEGESLVAKRAQLQEAIARLDRERVRVVAQHVETAAPGRAFRPERRDDDVPPGFTACTTWRT